MDAEARKLREALVQFSDRVEDATDAIRELATSSLSSSDDAEIVCMKVRKEKLGERVTALQQLVSPFGKPDTASVLHETIEYIKFLHDQVGVLSTPYLKSGHQVPQYLKSSSSSPDNSSKDGEVTLKGRGLCLVPISSMFAVASEVPVDFWTTFGANFR